MRPRSSARALDSACGRVPSSTRGTGSGGRAWFASHEIMLYTSSAPLVSGARCERLLGTDGVATKNCNTYPRVNAGTDPNMCISYSTKGFGSAQTRRVRAKKGYGQCRTALNSSKHAFRTVASCRSVECGCHLKGAEAVYAGRHEVRGSLKRVQLVIIYVDGVCCACTDGRNVRQVCVSTRRRSLVRCNCANAIPKVVPRKL